MLLQRQEYLFDFEGYAESAMSQEDLYNQALANDVATSVEEANTEARSQYVRRDDSDNFRPRGWFEQLVVGVTRSNAQP